MNFFGKTFLYDNISCEAYDLMLYDIDGGGEDSGEFASTVTVEEETVGKRWKPYFYGVRHEGKISFQITFGVNLRRVDDQKFLDRYEMSQVAAWLTGHESYKYLDIEQEDMQFVRYKAIISNLEYVSFGQIPWAMKATVECDGPYAYMYPQTYTYNLTAAGNGINVSTGETFTSVTLFNQSSLNVYYMPVVKFSQGTGSTGIFKIVNLSDGNREFKFTNLPAGSGTITVNNDNCLITCTNGLNLYPYFNNKFFRLVKGVNNLRLTGIGEAQIICEFPINTGG